MKTYEINLQHGKLTWDAAASSWLLSWVHTAPPALTEHHDHVGGSLADDLATLGHLVNRAIPRDLGPITGTIYVDEITEFPARQRGRIEVVASQIDTTWMARP